MDNPIRFSGAVHEAGHATVAWWLNVRVGAMRVHDDGSGGTDIADHKHLSLTDQLAICVAGMVAQDAMGCEQWEFAGFSDHSTAATILDDAGIDDSEHWRHVEVAFAQAHAILDARLDTLRLIAIALDAHGELTPQRVRELLEQQ